MVFHEPTADDILLLRSDWALSNQFDELYGSGAAARHLTNIDQNPAGAAKLLGSPAEGVRLPPCESTALFLS